MAALVQNTYLTSADVTCPFCDKKIRLSYTHTPLKKKGTFKVLTVYPATYSFNTKSMAKKPMPKGKKMPMKKAMKKGKKC